MSKRKRLHPVAIFLLSFSALKELIIPMVAAFIFGRGATPLDSSFTAYFISGGFLVLGLYGYLKWLTFTYEIDDQQLKIRQGIFIKKQRYIRKERIYSIDITAGVLQRLFHLVAVKVETAGGGNEPEVSLTAVTEQDADFLKNQLLISHSQEEVSEVDNEAIQIPLSPETEFKNDTVWKLSNQNLLLTALTSSGVGIVLMALIALLSQLEGWIPDEFLIDTFGYLFQSSIIFLIIPVMIIIILAWFVSIIGTVIKYGKFTINKKGDEIEITRGILEKRQLTLSLTRITAIRVVESILRQPFGLATVYVESAGGGSKDEQLSTVLFPIVRKKQLLEQLAEIVPEYAFEQPLEPLPKRARKRYIIRKLIPAALIAVPLIYFIPYGSVGATILLGLALLLGSLQYKNAGIGINSRFLWISFRTISKTLVIIPKRRIQAIEARQSFIQRFRSLFTVQASILTSISGKSFSSVDVGEEQKDAVLAWYSYKK
ncbi:PH domain-containing protein [Bacillaceae bacterium IKA-2]|nr:PH domain-containing protein [Bacillaceae bacterium IKA-2]